jgi:hypothetical protein
VSDEPIQFEKAEFAGPSATACAACGRRIVETYWEANGHLVCTECKDKLTGKRESATGLALSWGLAVAAVGALGWALLLKAGIVAGLLAVGIGWGMGWAMHRATEGRTTRFLQVAAVLLTVLSVVAGFGTYFVWEFDGEVSLGVVITALLVGVLAIKESSPLTWLIIGFGLWEAWRRTAPPVLNVTGPYRLSAQQKPAEPAAPAPEAPTGG